jgi:hypothetical protein
LRYDFVTADAIGKFLVVDGDGETIAEAVSEDYAEKITQALNNSEKGVISDAIQEFHA